MLRGHSIFKQGCPHRINLVGKQLDSVQLEIPDLSSSRSCDTNRCINGWMGSCLSRDKDRWSMVSSGKEATYQCFRIEGSQTSHFNLPQSETSRFYPLADRQHDSPVLSSEDGRYTRYVSNSSSKGNMGLPNSAQYHNYCRIPSQSRKCRGRQGVETCKGRFSIPSIFLIGYCIV